MNRPMNDDIHDLAGAYALDAVDDLDRARFETHLAKCDACQRDVDEFRNVAAALATGEATEPPPTLKPAVMQAVSRTRQERPGHPSASVIARGHAGRWGWRRRPPRP